MAVLKRSTGIPMWIMLAAFVAVMVPLLIVGFRARADTAAMTADCAATGRNWTVHTRVAERDDEPGYSWIKFNDYYTDPETVQPYVVRVKTAKAVGDEITVQIVWDCTGKHLSTTDMSQ